jgi:hypothetical protein
VDNLTLYFLGLLKAIFEREAKGDILCVNEVALVNRLANIGIDQKTVEGVIAEMDSQLAHL